MAVNFEEVKYIFTGDTSNLNEATSQAIGLLDQFGNEIRKTISESSKMDKIGDSVRKSSSSFQKMNQDAAQAGKTLKDVGKGFSLDSAKKQITAFALAMNIRLETLKMAFDPIVQKMQSLKAKASSTFPHISKLLGTVAAAFRRAAKSSDDESNSMKRNLKVTQMLRNGFANLSKTVQKLGNNFRSVSTHSKTLDQHLKSMTLTGQGLRSLFLLLTGIQLGKFFTTAIDSALRYTETLNQFNVVLGESVEAGEEFVNKIQEMYGLDPTTIMKMTSEFYQLSSAIEMPVESARKLSLGLTSTALDLASLFDRDFEKVAQDLASGMQGMTRSVRKYGIDLRQATLETTAASLGLKINAATTSEANRQALRYITIVRQARAASGDFAKTIESPANQLRILKEQFLQLARAIGNFFLPILQKILPYLNGIIMALVSIINFIRKLFGLGDIEFGGATDSAQDLAGGMGDVADGAEDATKKAKKLRKELMAPFDELNIFKEDEPDSDSGSGGAGAGGGGAGGLDPKLASALDDISKELTEVRMKANDVRDAILEFLGFSWDKEGKLTFDASQLQKNLIDKFPSWTKTINSFFENWRRIATAFQRLWTSLSFAIGKVFQGIVDGFTNMIQGLNLDVKVAAWLDELPLKLLKISTWISANSELFHTIGTMISYVGTAFTTWKIISAVTKPLQALLPILTALGPAGMLFVGAIGLIAAGFVDAWKNSESFRNAVGSLKTSFVDMCASLGNAWKTFWDVFGPLIKQIGQSVRELWKDYLAPLLAHVLEMVAEIITSVGGIVSWLIKTFGPTLSSALSTVVSIITTVVKGILTVIDGIVSVLKGIIKFINGAFSGDWKKAWSGIRDIFKGIWKVIAGVGASVCNIIIDAVNGLLKLVIDGINALVGPAMSGISKLAKKVGIDMPEKVGYIPKIPHIPMPKLAQGGVVSDPTVAMIGEGKYPEAVIPLGQSPQLAELVDKIAEAVDRPDDDDTPISVTVNLDSQVLFKSTQRASKKRGVDFKMGAFAR